MLDFHASYIQKIYVKTFARGGPFLIGIILAFYFHKSKPIKKSPISKFFPWAFIFLQLTLLYYSIEVRDKLGSNVFLNAFTIAFGRNIWSLGIAFLILLCKDGNGGFVNKFYSSKFWTLISKIGLSLYLVHPVLQYNSISSRKQQINLEIGPMVNYLLLKIMN
jgi:peptidoglycan/LPS O-acetylase OafA/YrhL